MKIHITYSIILLLLLSVLPVRADVIDDFRCSKGLSADNSALLVIDLADNKVIAEMNADKPLVPASIMKCVTTATLLDKMSEDDRFHTKVYTTGLVEDHILKGNIIVEGSGDPSLNSRHIEGNSDICTEIADALAAIGVTAVQGRIVADENLWSGPSVPSSWMSADLPHSYGTGSHALNFEDNASGSRSVSNPAAVFDTRLRAALVRKGIKVNGESLREGERELLVDHLSVPLDEIMRSCMMRSDNQYAEALLREYAVACGGKGNTAEAAEREMKYWKHHKAPMEGVKIVDGSGLSRQNRVTARFMAYVLSERAENPYYASFFPLAGQEGTLRKFLVDTPLEGYVAMKTGSMNGIQCYAGYKLDDDYVPTHIIVVMLNEMGRATAREAVRRALLEIFEDKLETNN